MASVPDSGKRWINAPDAIQGSVPPHHEIKHSRKPILTTATGQMFHIKISGKRIRL
jgi:hypothetical protein